MSAREPEQQQPEHPIREKAALVSYWLLFIFGPLIGLLWWGGVLDSASFVLPLFLVLILVGEHMYRWWRRLWRLP